MAPWVQVLGGAALASALTLPTVWGASGAAASPDTTGGGNAALSNAAVAAAGSTVVVRLAPGAAGLPSLPGGVHALGGAGLVPGRYVLKVPAGKAGSVAAALRNQPGVVMAEQAVPVHATQTPDDPCFLASCPATDENGNQGTIGSPFTASDSGYLNEIGAPAAWDISKGAGVTVGVIDSGVDASHPDLAGKVVGLTNDCADIGCSNTYDEFGHGTHVSGIIAADTDNGSGVASLGWSVSLDEYRVLDQNGDGISTDVANAIYSAVAAGDRVINLSLANYSCEADPNDCGPSADEEAAVEYAISKDVVVVAAAGNDGYDSDAYPASYPGVLSVAATDDSGVVQPFSQWGAAANVAAPGLGILSTWASPSCTSSDPGSASCYRLDSGTSMASPQVAAAAALLRSNDPSLSAPQIAQILRASARPTAGGNPIQGGVLDVPAGLAGESNPPHSYDGYALTDANGDVYSFGGAGYYGDLYGMHLSRPVVGIGYRSDGMGYWLVASDGGIFSFGDAGFHGSTGAIHLNQPIVGMAATPDGNGYWLVASDGGIFSFGDAGFHGSTGAIHLNQPIVGMAATPDGRGYWLVASDGGIFAFGDAGFHGSTGAIHLNRPIVGMAATPDGNGYWLVASDGGVFAFGDAGFHGSTGNIRLSQPVVTLATTPDGAGYWLIARDGGVFGYGDARFWGSTGGQALPASVVSAGN